MRGKFVSLIFEIALEGNPEQAKIVRTYRKELDSHLKEFESPFRPPYGHDLYHEERLSPLILWNAYYAGRCHNLLTKGLCLASWCMMHTVDVTPAEVAWEVLLQVSKQTGEELWRTDIPGVGSSIRPMFACRNFALESGSRPTEEGDDFHHDF